MQNLPQVMSKVMSKKGEWKTSIAENLKFQIQYKFFRIFVLRVKQPAAGKADHYWRHSWGRWQRQKAVEGGNRVVAAANLGFSWGFIFWERKDRGFWYSRKANVARFIIAWITFFFNGIVDAFSVIFDTFNRLNKLSKNSVFLLDTCLSV